jgi:glucose/arabinose dehydrogenase
MRAGLLAFASASVLASIASIASCGTSRESPSDAGTADRGVDSISNAEGGATDATQEPPPTPDAESDGYLPNACETAGSMQFTSSGIVMMGGGAPPASLSFLHLPVGFCAHLYGNVGNARQLRIAPGGELFVASPTTGTTGGGPNGQSAIMVLPDDNNDGTADDETTFLGNLPSTQGLMFSPGYFYYQDQTSVMRMPYTPRERYATAPGEPIVDVTIYESSLHWPKTFDMADDGTIYVGNGGDQGEECLQPPPFHGGILKVDGSEGGAPVAQGFRNPIALRCSHGHDLCFALELALDYSSGSGGREKMVPIRQGEDWGFPCCATTNVPYSGVTPVPDCSGVATDEVSFLIGDTPFGLAFEPGLWPAPWKGVAFVATHGAAVSWHGARLVAISLDPVTGLPVPGNDLDADVDNGGMLDFATGWDDGTFAHGRPAALEFSPDGRLFLSNDRTGDIIWIAPIGM